MKNIFYSANKELFSDNTRSHFNSFIDISDLNYLHDDFEVAIKSIAFDNTQSIHVLPNIKQPHFIIIQEIPRKYVYPEFFKPPSIKRLESENSIKEFISVDESKDFVIKNLCNAKVIFVSSH